MQMTQIKVVTSIARQNQPSAVAIARRWGGGVEQLREDAMQALTTAVHHQRKARHSNVDEPPPPMQCNCAAGNNSANTWQLGRQAGDTWTMRVDELRSSASTNVLIMTPSRGSPISRPSTLSTVQSLEGCQPLTSTGQAASSVRNDTTGPSPITSMWPSHDKNIMILFSLSVQNPI